MLPPTRPHRALVLLAVLGLSASLLGGVAAAHDERDVSEPEATPFPEYRQTGPSIVVCKPDSERRIASLPAVLRQRNLALLEDCRFEHIQQAVDWIAAEGEPGSRIQVLPGVYREEPSRHSRAERFGAPIGRDDLVDECEAIWEHAGDGEGVLSYDEEHTCPHIKNTVAILGDQTPTDDAIACDSHLCDLQVEGTGSRPADVIVDGKLRGFDNGMKADRARGFYVRNMAFQHYGFNGLYIIETSGATIDSAEGNYNHEYGFLSFLAHVRYENCEGRSNGDGALYPGASPNLLTGAGLIPLHRDEMSFSTHVRGCRGHHSELGFSGTSGNSVWMHHNEFDHNIAGINLDSFFPDHPGTPQNHALVEDNLIHSNNVDYYDIAAHRGLCDEPLHERDYEDGRLCPLGPAMLGSGIINPGANFNWYTRNHFYDNWRTGVIQFWVPAEVREGEPVPEAHFRPGCGADGDQTCPYEETSHWNTYSGNRLAEQSPFGYVQPNGADFTWDVEGEGNCWAQSDTEVYAANTSAAGDVTHRPYDEFDFPSVPVFPDCPQREQSYSPVSSVFDDTTCATYDQATNPDPEGCDWVEMPPMPDGRQPQEPTLERLAGADRVETAVLSSREGYPTDAPTVVLARSDAYPDALAGAPLARSRGGPLLLNPTTGLHPSVADEITRLGATDVILLGGPAALSPRIVEDLHALGFTDDEVVRIGGADRFETAALVARSMPATDALLAKGVDEGGHGWPDALAASAAAALLERPILLVEPTRLPAATEALLAEGDVEAVDIVGGPAAVSEEVADAVAGYVDEVERLAGATRFETSLEVARFAQLSADPTELWIATGHDWPDGIAAGSAIAVDEGILLLVGDEVEGSPLEGWLSTHPYLDEDGDPTTVADVVERIRLLGGGEAVPDAVADELRTRYGARDGDARGDRSTGTASQVGRLLGDGVRGTARIDRTNVGSTRLWVAAAGLTPGESYRAHVGTGSCGDGGETELAFPDGHGLHLDLIADGGGTVIADTTAFHLSQDRARSVTLGTLGEATVACAEL